MNREHCVVIGAGIIGISSAYYLAKRGYKVTVVEQGEIGSGASFGNAGIVAVGHPTMPRPGLVGQTLKWMIDKTSPIIPTNVNPLYIIKSQSQIVKR